MSEFIQEMDVIAMSFVDDRFDLAECFNKFDHNHAFKVEGSSSMNDYFKFRRLMLGIYIYTLQNETCTLIVFTTLTITYMFLFYISNQISTKP